MSWKSIGQAVLLMAGGWLYSLIANLVDYHVFGGQLGENELWEDAISFAVFILAAHFYHLKNTAIEMAKAYDEAGEPK